MSSALQQLFPRRRRRRRYHLSPQGLASLRRHARRNRPWEKSTGPKTILGKRVCSQNSLKHGFFSKDFADQSAAYASVQRWVKRQTSP